MTTDSYHHNQGPAELRRRAGAIKDVLDDIADKQEELKALRAEAKADGFDMKALNQVVKEMRRGPDFQAAQLELELVLDTYRKGVGLPVTLEAAQEAAAKEAEKLPPAKDRSKPSGERLN